MSTDLFVYRKKEAIGRDELANQLAALADPLIVAGTYGTWDVALSPWAVCSVDLIESEPEDRRIKFPLSRPSHFPKKSV